MIIALVITMMLMMSIGRDAFDGGELSCRMELLRDNNNGDTDERRRRRQRKVQ